MNHTLDGLIAMLTKHRNRVPHLAKKPVDIHNADSDDAPAIEVVPDPSGEPKTLIILNLHEEDEPEPPHPARKSTRHRKANRRASHHTHRTASDEE